jgi:DNA-binding transcriptional regulator YiaG
MTKEMIFGHHARKEPLHYRECGLDDVYLFSGYDFVPAGDGTHDLVVQDIDGLHRAIAECLVTERKMLTGKEFAFLRRHLGLTQPELAMELGATVQTIYRWESEQSRIPGPADTLLRFVYLARTRPDIVADAARVIVRHLREMERPRTGKLVFRDTKRGWLPMAA